jgi:hypothetical protein
LYIRNAKGLYPDTRDLDVKARLRDGFRCPAARGRRTNAPIQQGQLAGGDEFSSHQAIEVDPGGRGFPLIVGAVPDDFVGAGCQLLTYQASDVAPQQVVHLEPYLG